MRFPKDLIEKESGEFLNDSLLIADAEDNNHPKTVKISTLQQTLGSGSTSGSGSDSGGSTPTPTSAAGGLIPLEVRFEATDRHDVLMWPASANVDLSKVQIVIEKLSRVHLRKTLSAAGKRYHPYYTCWHRVWQPPYHNQRKEDAIEVSIANSTVVNGYVRAELKYYATHIDQFSEDLGCATLREFFDYCYDSDWLFGINIRGDIPLGQVYIGKACSFALYMDGVRISERALFKVQWRDADKDSFAVTAAGMYGVHYVGVHKGDK